MSAGERIPQNPTETLDFALQKGYLIPYPQLESGRNGMAYDFDSETSISDNGGELYFHLFKQTPQDKNKLYAVAWTGKTKDGPVEPTIRFLPTAISDTSARGDMVRIGYKFDLLDIYLPSNPWEVADLRGKAIVDGLFRSIYTPQIPGSGELKIHTWSDYIQFTGENMPEEAKRAIIFAFNKLRHSNVRNAETLDAVAKKIKGLKQ